jgi:hypothetical protein
MEHLESGRAGNLVGVSRRVVAKVRNTKLTGAKAAPLVNAALAAGVVLEGPEAGRPVKADTAGNRAIATAVETEEGSLEVSSGGTAAKACLVENMAMAPAMVARATGVATGRLALAMATKAPLAGSIAKAARAKLAALAIPEKTAAMEKVATALNPVATALNLQLSRRVNANVPVETLSRPRQAVRMGWQVKRTRLERSRNRWRRAHLARRRSQLDRPPLRLPRRRRRRNSPARRQRPKAAYPPQLACDATERLELVTGLGSQPRRWESRRRPWARSQRLPTLHLTASRRLTEASRSPAACRRS